LNIPIRNSKPVLMLAAGLGLLYVPTLARLASELWRSDQNAHGPLILAVSSWLLWRRRAELCAARREPSSMESGCGWAVLLAGLGLYVVGRSQNIDFIELGSLIWVLAGTILLTCGARSLKVVWFPIFFMLFMVPLPGLLVATVTMPMKIAVSYVAEALLHGAGYPIARTGVIMQIGQYQLLVADACAGLHTLLTLEAMGLLYLNLTPHTSMIRNIALAVLVVPISFAANVIRVTVLSLVTYHMGDEAGQGFLHGFAGMVLFMTALSLLIGADSMLRGFARHQPVRASLGAA
jgi:exosortase B